MTNFYLFKVNKKTIIGVITDLPIEFAVQYIKQYYYKNVSKEPKDIEFIFLIHHFREENYITNDGIIITDDYYTHRILEFVGI